MRARRGIELCTVISFRRKPLCYYVLAAAVAVAAVQTGCTDVGDSSAGGGTDASGTDAEGAETSLGADAPASPDSTLGNDGAPAEQDGEVDATTTQPETGVDGGPVETPDSESEAATPTEGGSEGGVPEAGAPETGAPEAGPTEAGAADAGEHDAGLAEAGADGGGSTLVPCTTAGQTHCIQCDQSTDGVCTPTEAIVVTRDIEEGLVTGTLPNPYSSATPSCYECAVANDCLDSPSMGFVGLECGDLSGAAVQECLDAFNCILGSPQSGTAGASGTVNPSATPATLAADCSNDSTDGVFNCFCGTAEPSTSHCSAAGTVASMATGGVGVASPNGVCIPQVFAGTGTTSSTANGTIITALSNTSFGAGLAFSFPQCVGSNLAAGQACEQCYK
jgi:hypothetical protein